MTGQGSGQGPWGGDASDLLGDGASSAERVAAMGSNLVAFYGAYGRGRGCTLTSTPAATWFYTGVPSPLFNGVLAIEPEPAAVEDVVAVLRARIEEHGAPALWWLGPGSAPDRLGTLLERHGLRPAGTTPGMAIELAALDPAEPVAAGLIVRRVSDAEMQVQWARVAATGTGFPEDAVAALVRLEGTLSDPSYRAQHRYLGYLDGVPVATSAMVLEAGVAGIYAVATLPAARRRGIGRSMTVRPLLEARRRGYRLAVLQSSAAGYAVYQRIGFERVCSFATYLQSRG